MCSTNEPKVRRLTGATTKDGSMWSDAAGIRQTPDGGGCDPIVTRRAGARATLLVSPGTDLRLRRPDAGRDLRRGGRLRRMAYSPAEGADMTSGAGLSRRTLLRGAAATAGLGVGALAAGCSSDVMSGLTAEREAAGSLDYWNLFGGGDGVRMQQMLDTYRAANAGVALGAVTLAWGN